MDHRDDNPEHVYQHYREELNAAWRWLHSFSDHQTVVLNMSRPSFWNVTARAIRNAPWS